MNDQPRLAGGHHPCRQKAIGWDYRDLDFHTAISVLQSHFDAVEGVVLGIAPQRTARMGVAIDPELIKGIRRDLEAQVHVRDVARPDQADAPRTLKFQRPLANGGVADGIMKVHD